MAGLGNANLRVVPPVSGDLSDSIDVDVSDMMDQAADVPNAVEIELPDGSIKINLGALGGNAGSNSDEGFDANLADQIDDVMLGQIADELLRGVEDETDRDRFAADRRGVDA